MIPQILFIIIVMLGAGVTIAKHGEPQKPHNIVTTLIAQVIMHGLLFWGGFYDCFFK
jgi:hypothetical protein